MQLNKNNFIQFANTHYKNPNGTSLTDFESDLCRFKYINKLFKRYIESGIIKERIVLNHIIILYNVFGNNASFMLFYKIKEDYAQMLLTFMIYLNRLPENQDVGPLDQNIIDILRKI